MASANHPIQELAAVPAMAVAAAATTTLRVGCRVFCVDYRHPAVLAKETATLDLLSDGRIEIGLGAGWLRGEYEALGMDFDPADAVSSPSEEPTTVRSSGNQTAGGRDRVGLPAAGLTARRTVGGSSASWITA